MGKYDHLESLRQKIAKNATKKRRDINLAELLTEFDECLRGFKPNCDDNKLVLEKLRCLQDKIKIFMSGETAPNV
jgi:hypothetical protein